MGTAARAGKLQELLIYVAVIGFLLAAPASFAGDSGPGLPASAGLPAAAGNPEGAKLTQLLHSHPELISLLKTYLAQAMRLEGSEVSEKTMPDSMLFARIQSDPVFAKNASQWLATLAKATTQALKAPAPLRSNESNDSARAEASNHAQGSLPADTADPRVLGLAQNAPIADDDVPLGEQRGAKGTQSISRGASTPNATAASSKSAYVETPRLRVSLLPKYLLEDQKAFWTLPFHMNVTNLAFVVPATFGTAILVGTDTAIEQHLPSSPSTVKHAADASTAGALALVGAGGALFMSGSLGHNDHQRETGFLAGEAAIDAYATSTAIQYMTGRERPYTGNNKGHFFEGGNSFPSNTAAVAWGSASVLAHEYPGFLTKLLAYGVAGGVSAGRVIGEKHWTSDAFVGSALGWYMGRQIYRARSQGPEIDARTWATFEKSPEEHERNPAYMGTTFVPLDSWVYSAFDRLSALGYAPTEITAIKPWARMECARLVLEAQQQFREAEEHDVGVKEIIDSLRQEFSVELANLEGASNLGVELDSAYARITAIGGRPLRDGFNFAQTIYDDYGRPYGQGFNMVDGGEVRAEAGPLAFYFRGEFQHGSSLPNYSPAQAQQIVASNGVPLLPLSAVPTFNEVNQFKPIEAYAALNVANWQVSFGYQTYSWGPEYGGGLMFSNNAPSEPMLKFGRVVPVVLPEPFAWLGQIRNTLFFGALPDYHWLRGPYPEFPVTGNPYTAINPVPYTWGDKLALKMTQNFEVGVALSVVWAGQGRPATEQTWIHTFNSNGNVQRLDPGKRYTGINCSYRLPKMRDWVTLYIDGMANDQPNPIAYPQDSAFGAGLYFPKLPKLPKLDLRVEGVYTNVPGYPGIGEYYKNERYAQGYTIDWQLIGNWVGRQGDGIQAWSTYWFSSRNKVQLGYRRQWVDPILNGGGGLNDFSGTVEWLFKHDIQVSSTLQYERWNFPLLSSNAVGNFSTSVQVMYTPEKGLLRR